MERFDNWMTYSFSDGIVNGSKPKIDSGFNLNFKKGYRPKTMSYYDALYYNTRSMKDSYKEPFDVLFSGGIDSEIIVRLFKDEGVRFNVYTIRLENGINEQDVNAAIRIAENIGIKLNIIDWNLQKFLENDAEEMFNRTFCPEPRLMLRNKWFELLDNIPVMGAGEPYWRRELMGDYSKKSDWHLKFTEDGFSASIYGNLTGRKVIGEWYNYTPEIVMNFHKLPIIKDLLDDRIIGKQSCWSTRTQIHRELWSDIFDKPKLGGLEGVNGKPGDEPESMTVFSKTISSKASNRIYRYSVSELENIFNDEEE
jgi:hypothetical protein